MFERTRVPVLGLIENMSFYCCPNCNHRSEIFSHGGAKLEAARMGSEFLGEIPLVLEIRTNADAGTSPNTHTHSHTNASAYPSPHTSASERHFGVKS